MTKDIHTKILEWARDNDGFTSEELQQKFPDEWPWLKREVEHSNVFQASGSKLPYRHHLSFEDRFRLLEMQELREARKASTIAQVFSGISLLIAAISLFIAAIPK